MPTLSELRRYPVKSCRGASVEQAVVERCGLAGDRRWLVSDPEGTFRTAREMPRLLLIEATPTAGGLRLSAPDMPDLTLEAPADGAVQTATVWRSRVPALRVPQADAWLSEVLGATSRLLHLHDPTRRLPDQDFAGPGDRVSFADGYPLLATTTASLTALNDWILEGPDPADAPLPMTRFRPNLVIDGTVAWQEDGWRRLRVGSATFRAVKGCDRCAITLTDPDTLQRGREPIATLARHRRWDGGVWFGMNLVPDTPGATVRVGAEVEILEAVDAPDGPPR